MAAFDLRVWAALAAAGLVVSSGFAQPDSVETQRALRQVADQRTEQNVREALELAEKDARVSKTRAIEQLKKLAEAIDLNVQISSKKREELAQLVQTKLAALQGKPAPQPPDPRAKQQQEKRQKAYEVGAAEAKEVREAVVEVQKLHDVGKYAQASSKIGELAKKYPQNPAVQILAGQGMMGDRITEARLLSHEMNLRNQMAMLDTARSSLPPKGDMELPADWAEKTKRRRDALQPKLSKEEESILQALDSVVKQGLNNAPFEEAVQQLSTLIDKPIYLDKNSLSDAGLDMKKPVSMPANVTARTALRALLQSQGLTFVIKDKVIQVLTLERASETLVTRAYDITDLTKLSGPFGGAVTWGPAADYQQTLANAEIIIKSIKASVDPQVWSDNHGIATISFLYPGTIIVRAPSEVHVSLGKSLGR
jgi:hypothetical protein